MELDLLALSAVHQAASGTSPSRTSKDLRLHALPVVQLFQHQRQLIDQYCQIYPLEEPFEIDIARDRFAAALLHLQALLPSRLLEEQSAQWDIRNSRMTNIRRLLYGVTNNFNDNEYNLPTGSIDQALTKLVPLAAREDFGDQPLLHAFAEGLFRSALRTGNEIVVSFLFRNDREIAGIDIDDHVCLHMGRRVTPVELSVALGHRGLTKLLISRGADLDKTLALESFGLDCPRGALEWALNYEDLTPHSHQDDRVRSQVSLDQGTTSDSVLEDVIVAGGTLVSLESDSVPHRAIKVLEKVRHLPILSLLLAKLLPNRESIATWERRGLFHIAFSRLDSDSLRELLKFMKDVDLNTMSDIPELAALMDSEHDPCGTSLRFQHFMARKFGVRSAFAYIDIAARRGMEPLVRHLQCLGARQTPNFGPAAVRSGNPAMLNLLHLSCLSLGAEMSHQYSPAFHATTFSEALRSGNRSTLQLCETDGHFAAIRDENQQAVLLAAAARSGECGIVVRLLSLTHLRDINLLAPALVEAAEANHAHICQAILAAGVPLSHFGKAWHAERHHPLVAALKNKNPRLVNILLEHGIVWSQGGTELEEAVRWGNEAVVSQLLAAGAPQGNSLAVSVESGAYELFHKILSVSSGDERIANALTTSVRLQKPVITDELLESGADPANASALIEAVEHAPATLELLLERFAVVYPQGKQGFGADVLLAAVSKGRKENLKKLLDLGIGVSAQIERPGYRDHTTALAQIIEDGDVNTVRVLLAFDPGLDSIIKTKASTPGDDAFPSNETPLLVAIAARQHNMVAFLIGQGAKVNLPASGLLKRTPLQRAAEVGALDIVKLLLSKGADVNAAPAKREGLTALQAAARSGFIGVAELLLAHGANLYASGSEVWGRTALQVAAWRGRLDMIHFLLHYGSHPEQDCRNAVLLAKRRGHMPIVRLLERYIADDRASRSRRDRGWKPDTSVTFSQHEQPLVRLDARTGEWSPNRNESLEPRAETSHQGLNQAPDQSTSQPSSHHEDDDIVMASISPSLPPSSPHLQRRNCRTCNKSFTNASSLRRHQRHACASGTVEAKPALQCPVCHKHFARKDIYARHKATHEERRTSTCEKCGGAFSRKDYLKIHLQICKGQLLDDNADENGDVEHGSGSETVGPGD